MVRAFPHMDCWAICSSRVVGILFCPGCVDGRCDENFVDCFCGCVFHVVFLLNASSSVVVWV